MVDDDFDGHALNDLDEIAGGVFRREGGELGAGAKLDAVDVTVEVELRISVDADFDGLSGAHQIELVLLEVGGDPDLRRDDREDLLPGSDVVADLDVSLGDP